MLNFSLPRLRCILLLGAHADDIEIGCGGLVLQLASRLPEAEFHWNVFSAAGHRAREARSSAADFLHGTRNNNIVIHDYRDGFFPYVGTEIKDAFEQLKKSVEPDLILTHYGHDLHQDHRLMSELTWNTFRDHLILEYEIPKYDGGLGSPNFFVPLSADERRRKVRLLLEHFISQKDKPWFTADTFDAVMRLRGVESNAASGFAEAFYCRKVCCRLLAPPCDNGESLEFETAVKGGSR
jgi:LmbE family N-acetylglucosaminyl deacetylase